MLTHLGECERGLGNHKGALSYFERARQTAEQAGDTFGHVIATVNQARALVQLRPAAAGPLLASLEAQIATVPAAQRMTLIALLEVTRAEHAAMEQRTLDAEASFVRALDAVERSTLVSPIEHALIARSAARFQTEVFGGGRNVEYLQRALRLLDATSATALRADVEQELRRASNDAWTLHVVSRFLGRSAVELAMREAGQAGFRGQRVELAVLFADLRGFTSAAEGLSPGELVDALNQILSRMAACVETMGGLVDKFVGDAVMALYGVEVDPAKAASGAVRSALLMQAELERLNRHAGKLGSLQMGVGVHFGPAVLGLIGSAQHRSYTALGDTVNFASRLEGMTKQLGATVLISGAVVKHLNEGDFVLRALGRYAPKGAAVPIECFDVMGEARDAALSGRLQEELAASRGAVTATDVQEFEAARVLLSQALALARGTYREAGYRLRLMALDAGDPVVRLSEK